MEATVDDVPTDIEIHKNPTTGEITIFKYRPEFIISEKIINESTTTVQTDLSSGQEVIMTNDQKILQNN